MIKQLFLPDKIGNRRILDQRIIGIAVSQTSIHAALIYAKRNKTYLESLKSEPIPEGTEETYAERAAQTIKKIMLFFPSYDQIRISIPASSVVFKELQLHFTDPEKIRMVLDYEIESMLPFSIHDAITDFVITKKDITNQTAQILVAAVRTQNLQEQIDIFTKAGIEPTSITIDLFALYGLYQQIPEYASLPNAVALVELTEEAMRVAFIQNGQLRITRSIQRGYTTVLKLISDELKISQQELAHQLSEKGLQGNDDATNRIIQKHFVLLLNDLQFTLNSFSLKLNQYEGVTKVLFVGQAQAIRGFTEFCSDTLQIPCETLDGKKLFTLKTFKNKIKESITNWSMYDVALGTAIPSIEQSDFDLRRKQFAFHKHGLMVKQIIAAGALSLILFSTILIKGYFDISKLSDYATMVEQREIGRVKTENVFSKERFPKKPTLASIVREGEKAVKEKSEIWEPFGKKGMRPLELWLEITRIVDKKQFDVNITALSLSTKDKDGHIHIEVDGIFKSKTGNHFGDFSALLNRFKESPTLKYIELDDSVAPEGGVNFSVKLQPKEI